ncbi:hypothetical protein Lal_00037906 [Lupinus albus]|nr:hypothetical protein Lal_00037906 [Lupinus albus]
MAEDDGDDKGRLFSFRRLGFFSIGNATCFENCAVPAGSTRKPANRSTNRHGTGVISGRNHIQLGRIVNKLLRKMEEQFYYVFSV